MLEVKFSKVTPVCVIMDLKNILLDTFLCNLLKNINYSFKHFFIDSLLRYLFSFCFIFIIQFQEPWKRSLNIFDKLCIKNFAWLTYEKKRKQKVDILSPNFLMLMRHPFVQLFNISHGIINDQHSVFSPLLKLFNNDP